MLIRSQLRWLVLILAATFLWTAPFDASASDGDSRRGRSERERDRDDDDRREHARSASGERDDHDEKRARGLRARLRVDKTDLVGAEARWVRLDATRSRVKRAQIVSFHFEVRDRETGRLIPGPGQIAESVVYVELPAGRYEASVEVHDDQGRVSTDTERFKVKGVAQASGPALVGLRMPKLRRTVTHSDWVLGKLFDSQSVQSFYRENGFPVGLVVALAEVANQRNAALVMGAPAPEPVMLGASGGGCGGGLDRGSFGLEIFSSAVKMGTLFEPEVKIAGKEAKEAWEIPETAFSATGAGMEISGANKSDACLEAQLDSINDELAFQESQIQDLYSIIDRDQEAFFVALTQLENQVSSGQTDSFDTATNTMANYLNSFMENAALWDGSLRTGPGPWEDPSGSVLPLDYFSLATCPSALAGCCAGALDPLTCSRTPDPDGLFPALNSLSLSAAPTFESLVENLTGTRLNPGCTGSSCWKHVSPATVNNSVLLQILDRMATDLEDAVDLCTATDPSVRANCPNAAATSSVWSVPANCSDTDPSGCSNTGNPVPLSNDVVALFDQYNDAVVYYYLQAMTSLQQAYSIENFVNIYNYNRREGIECASGQAAASGFTLSGECSALQANRPNLPLQWVSQYGDVPGTYYGPSLTRFCGSSYPPATPREHAQAFNCAQAQLQLLYAQRANLLYRHMLSYIITDGPVGPQAYPETVVQFPGLAGELLAGIRAWHQRVDGSDSAPGIDYAGLLGSALPAGSRTPMDILRKVAGDQTASPQGYDWTAGSTLYQAYQVADHNACMNTLLAFQATAPPGSTVAEAFTTYDSCPRLFVRPDQTPINEGFFDGITAQPYAFQEMPDATTDCPAVCQSCQQTTQADAYMPGQQGLVDVGGVSTCIGYCSADNYCGDYRFATGSYTDCTACADSWHSPPTPDPSWPNNLTGGNGSWSSTCNPDTAILSEQDGVPTLSAECLADGAVAPAYEPMSGPVPCPGAIWTNSNGTIICSDGYLGVAVPDPDWATIGYSGSWFRTCKPGTAILSEDADGTPTLSAECQLYDQPGVYGPQSDPVPCDGAVWANVNGTPVCVGGQNNLANNDVAVGPRLTPQALGNVRQCESTDAASLAQAAVEGTTGLTCSGQVFFGKRYADSLTANGAIAPGSFTEASFLEMLSDRNTWYSADMRFNGGSGYDCTNDWFPGDPAPNFYKQCFCYEGNALTWDRPSTTKSASDFAEVQDNAIAGSLPFDATPAGLPYLRCGNHKVPDGPRVPWEYGYSGGSEYESTNDDPPTIFINSGGSTLSADTNQISTATPTLESDIGVRSSDETVASGLHYEVTFVNLYGACNASDNTDLDIRAFDGADCEASPDNEAITIDGNSNDAWASGLTTTTTANSVESCLSATFPIVRNRDNDETAFLSTLVTLPAVSSGGQGAGAAGPVIPIDIAYQCSDDSSIECAGESKCMYLATNRDADWTDPTVTEEERAEILAKRGYICQAGNYERSGDYSNGPGAKSAEAHMYCEVADGRVYRLRLYAYIQDNFVNDNRAYLDIELWDSDNKP